MLKTKITYIILLSSLFFLISCQTTEKIDLKAILKFDKTEFNNVINDPRYKFQLVLTQIDKQNDSIDFITHQFNTDTSNYFYPASSVKMPIAVLALQRLNEIKRQHNLPSINRKTDIIMDSMRSPQTHAHYDSTTINNRPNIENYINKVFAVSDNDAYNRLFEFLGSDYINKNLRKKGCFTNSKIVHRVGVPSFDKVSNQVTNSFHFLNHQDTLYSEEEKRSQLTFPAELNNLQQGVGFYKGDSLIQKPFDFAHKNFVNLLDYTEIMKRIFYPETFHESLQFDLTHEQLLFLRESMGKTPRQHTQLKYDTSEYYDSYVKFLMFGNSKKPIPSHIKIHNKVGYAYGYLTDIAFIRDTKHNVEYILCASVFVNANDTFNDDNYEYDTLGIPFLTALGRKVHLAMVNEL